MTNSFYGVSLANASNGSTSWSGNSCRYHDGGDVSRINHMQAGETLHISEEAHECLLQAMEASIHTGGLFNPTLWNDD